MQVSHEFKEIVSYCHDAIGAINEIVYAILAASRYPTIGVWLCQEA